MDARVIHLKWTDEVPRVPSLESLSVKGCPSATGNTVSKLHALHKIKTFDTRVRRRNMREQSVLDHSIVYTKVRAACGLLKGLVIQGLCRLLQASRI